MAFYNPATWTFVDNIQGQNEPRQTSVGDYTPVHIAEGLNASNDPGIASTVSGGAGVDVGGAIYGGTNPVGPTQAQIAEANRQASVRSSVNAGKQNVFTSANEAAGAYGANTKNSILDWLSGLRTTQQGIDNKRVNAELGRQRGTSGILDMMGRGIRSGQTMLNNRNAGDSSAAGAIARAYGDLGRRQQSGVNNQFALTQRNIGQEQEQFGQTKESGIRGFQTSKDQKIQEITSNARNALLALNDQLAGAGLGDRIAIDTEKERIRNDALNALAGLDAELANANNIQAMGDEGVRTQAGQLNREGAVGGDQFNFSENIPGVFQNSGAGYSDLPLYSQRRNRQA